MADAQRPADATPNAAAKSDGATRDAVQAPTRTASTDLTNLGQVGRLADAARVEPRPEALQSEPDPATAARVRAALATRRDVYDA